MIKKGNQRIEVVVEKKLFKDCEIYIKDFAYSNLPDLIREALREKIYGKNIKEEIVTKFFNQINKEKDFVFKENKNIYQRLKKIAENF